MILYLSAAIPDECFSQYLKDGVINAGHQAQKFNSMVIRGISSYDKVQVVSNPPYCKDVDVQSSKYLIQGECVYNWTKSSKGKCRKLSNLIQMKRAIKRGGKYTGIVCDAINPLASLLAIRTAKKQGIPAIAIVTDIPQYMDLGRETLFTRLTELLLSKYDGYVLLTEAMNNIVNKKNKPFIVMEGLCERVDCQTEERKDDLFTCMYAGSLSEVNGIKEFINGFLKADLPDSQFLIYGNGPYVDGIKTISAQNPKIKYCGVVSNSEIVELQKRVTLLVNPRPVDIAYANVSFPSKVIEYMASGTPLLTTHLPGIPEEYFDYVFECECTESDFSKKLKELFLLPREELYKKGKEAMQFVQQNKNTSVQGKRVINLMEGL